MTTTASWIIVEGKDLLPCMRTNCPLPTRARFCVIHQTNNFYLNIKILIKSLIANITGQIVPNDFIGRYRNHFQLAGNKFVKCETIQSCTYIRECPKHLVCKL